MFELIRCCMSEHLKIRGMFELMRCCMSEHLKIKVMFKLMRWCVSESLKIKGVFKLMRCQVISCKDEGLGSTYFLWGCFVCQFCHLTLKSELTQSAEFFETCC